MTAAQKGRPAGAGNRPAPAAPMKTKSKTAGQAGEEGGKGGEVVEKTTLAAGRPKAYETPEALEEAVEAYFDSITRTVDAVELVDSGKKDGSGHAIYRTKKILNDDGEVIRKVEFVLPPTVTDLCLCLGITRQTWVNYRDRNGYREIVERAKTRILGYLERELLTRTKGLQGVIFNLERNYKQKGEEEENRPLTCLDLSKLTDEELRGIAMRQSQQERA